MGSLDQKITAIDGVETRFLIIEGNTKLKRKQDIDQVRLSLEYFPNIHDSEVVASVEVVEVK
ncbi:hypothetical protein [Achromobacter sp. UBA4530]|uniref:hypothetical protein n=1 Tax=Achromobacter sp. UBA4530 TaxID=1945912 RepID=UPI00257BDF4F|nr:hypothetical protein [Achromobacter sp. UBA4530]